MAVKDYYRLLGVEMDSSGEEIKKAYRKLAMAYHPDRNRNKPGYEEMLKDINEAYQVLGDEEKRWRYDLSLQRSFESHVNYEEDLSDDLMEILHAFSRMSFRMKGFGGCRGRNFKRRGCGRRNSIF